ncbi:acyltransferase [Paraburkholderia caribensis]|uniref:Acyltransferase n=1 Tax=Paraburkholderia caribensis TaxID=75105 RepID=A0ABV0DTN3_9BURK|nr:acyltransferase [Paraburkholderia caribensis]MCO4880893.1 acyltransferase [Paraburkholderia caribensis]PTB24622.1 acetyltransferase [Paraburkholderia caribensis]
MLRVIVNRALMCIRPGKRVSDQISTRDLFVFLLEHVVNAIRGSLRSLQCRHTTFCFMGRSVKLRFARNIDIGRYTVIGDGAILSGLGSEGLRLGDGVNIGAYARIVVGTDIERPGAYIHIGDGCGIGEYSSVGGSGGVSIGQNTIIGQYFSAHPENHNFSDASRPIREQGTTRQPIEIGDDCWLGARVTVLAGVTIGDGCVIAAGSVVTRDISPFSIVAGVPGRVISSRGRGVRADA